MPGPSNTHFYFLPIIVIMVRTTTQRYRGPLIVCRRGIRPIPPNFHTQQVWSQSRVPPRHAGDAHRLGQVADLEEHDARAQAGGGDVEQAGVKDILLLGVRFQGGARRGVVRDHGHLGQLGLEVADAAGGLAGEAPGGDVRGVADEDIDA